MNGRVVVFTSRDQDEAFRMARKLSQQALPVRIENIYAVTVSTDSENRAKNAVYDLQLEANKK